MDEIRWQHGMDQLRSVQDLAREGRYQEAAEQARQALISGRLGRRIAARLHSLLCWLYVSPLQEPSMAAVLHGEEAVRLADLIRDPWIRCEALTRLIPAYCHLGDTARALEAWEGLAQEVDRHETVIDGGRASLWLLRAHIALAAGDLEDATGWLDQAEEAAGPESREMWERIRRHREMVEALLDEPLDQEAAQVRANQALQRAIASGRADLVRLIRRRLAHLLSLPVVHQEDHGRHNHGQH